MRYTVGDLRRVLDQIKADDEPVVVHIWRPDDVYLKAYVTGVSHVHDYLPDVDGGDDIHNAGFILLIAGELPEEEDS